VICLPPGISDLPTKTRSAASKALNVELLRAKVVISCVGLLVEPNAWPEHISGKSLFEGRIVHSARWPKDLDLNEKDVLVIGSGCSAAQIVPSILNDTIVQVKSVTQILRTPPWVEPRIAEPGGKERYGRWAPKVFRYLPFLGWVVRGAIFLYTEFLWATVFQQKQSWMRRLAEKRSLAHMKGKAPEKYHAILTPRYSYGCKRRVFDNAWLESTNDARFTLTTQSLKRVEAHHAILVKEGESEEMMVKADVIVLANGFEATYLLRSLEVYGSQGNSIYEVWKENDNAQAYIGLGVHGFPNFFMTVGPNTFVGHSSVIIGIEATVSYILKMITPILKGEVDTVEPKMEAMRNWNEGIRRDLKKTIFSGCMSWYKDEKGTNSILYPYVYTILLLSLLFSYFIIFHILHITSINIS
jgi:cation diffusion facilitator CzcD-associated flavoprotein CzcO